jgi:sodium-dependent dicarboxylate transporter 2/3/5
MIPVIKSIIEAVSDIKLKKQLTTHLTLALIYGANIGGIASLTGTSLNVFSLGLLEIFQIQGRENVTFFSWLLIGIPGTIILIFMSRIVLRIGEKKIISQKLSFPSLENVQIPQFKKILVFFVLNISLFFTLTGLQFVLKPEKIISHFNIIDLILIFYLILFIFYAFIYPKREKKSLSFFKNFIYLLLFLILFPLIFFIESYKEIKSRLFIKETKLSITLDQIPLKIFNFAWFLLFRKRLASLKKEYRNTYIPVNRMIYDLPFFGIVFMSLIILSFFILLKLGDNPATPHLDGYLFHFFENFSSHLIPHSDQIFVFILGIIFISIFLTEFLNNTTVILITFPIIINICLGAGLNPLVYLLAVAVSSNGAFMTPIASSQNAMAFAGVRGVSLKKMLKHGILLNL